MLFRVFMLLSLSAARAYGQGFVCGYEPSGDEVSGTSSRSKIVDLLGRVSYHQRTIYVAVAAPVESVPALFYDAKPTPPGRRTLSETRPAGWPPIHATNTSKFSGGTHEIV